MIDFLRPNLNQSAETAAQKAKGLFNKLRSHPRVKRLNSNLHSIAEGTQMVIDYATKDFDIPEFDFPPTPIIETDEQFVSRKTGLPTRTIHHVMNVVGLFEDRGLIVNGEPPKELITHISSLYPRRIPRSRQDVTLTTKGLHYIYRKSPDSWR